MDWKQVEERWEQLKGSAKAKWPKLTDEDLDLCAGKRILLAGLVQERYDITWQAAERQVEEWKASSDAQPAKSRAARRAG